MPDGIPVSLEEIEHRYVLRTSPYLVKRANQIMATRLGCQRTVH
jgi:hypothetical protein